MDQLVDLLGRVGAIDSEINRLGPAPDGTGTLAKAGADALRDLRLPAWQGSREWPLYRPLNVDMIAPAPVPTADPRLQGRLSG